MEDVADIFTWLFILILVVFFFVFMVFSDALQNNEIEAVAKVSNDIDAYNYHPSLLAYLNTNVEYQGNNVSIFYLLDEYSDGFNDATLHDFLKIKTGEIFEEMETCAWKKRPGSGIEDYSRLKFKVFVITEEEWDKIKGSAYKKTDKENTFYGKSEVTRPMDVVSVKLNEDYTVYLGIVYSPRATKLGKGIFDLGCYNEKIEKGWAENG